jgi:hypothetical protein
MKSMAISAGSELTTPTSAPRETVVMICNAIALLMPPPFEDRTGLAAELMRAHGQVISHLAGQIAEGIFIGERLEHTEHDEEDARAIAALVCRSEDAIDAYVDYCAVEARALLREHAEMVQAIADGLVAHRMLARPDIDKIVARLGEVRHGARRHTFIRAPEAQSAARVSLARARTSRLHVRSRSHDGRGLQAGALRILAQPRTLAKTDIAS